MDDDHKSQKARGRWRILSEALRYGRLAGSKTTVRLESDIALFHKREKQKQSGVELKIKGSTLLEYTYVHNNKVTIDVLQRSNSISLAELTSEEDNTGNICVWPSEETLSYFALKYPHLFFKKRVLELGAGLSGLASLIITKYLNPNHVFITDGNLLSIETLQSHIDINCKESSNVTTMQLTWGNELHYSGLKNSIDVIISADCLFFSHVHRELITSIQDLLSTHSQAFFIAPKRGDTLFRFVDLIKSDFPSLKVDVNENFDDWIKSQYELIKNCDPNYSTDLHYPILVTIEKVGL